MLKDAVLLLVLVGLVATAILLIMRLIAPSSAVEMPVLDAKYNEMKSAESEANSRTAKTGNRIYINQSAYDTAVTLSVQHIHDSSKLMFFECLPVVKDQAATSNRLVAHDEIREIGRPLTDEEVDTLTGPLGPIQVLNPGTPEFERDRLYREAVALQRANEQWLSLGHGPIPIPPLWLDQMTKDADNQHGNKFYITQNSPICLSLQISPGQKIMLFGEKGGSIEYSLSVTPILN